MSQLGAFRTLVAWDFVREMRRKNTIVSMGMMALVTLVVFAFAVPPTSTELTEVRAGVLWVTLFLAATVGVDRAFRGDGEGRMLEGLLLAPVARSTIYYARVASTLLFVLAIAVPTCVLFLVIFNLEIPGNGALWIAITGFGALLGLVSLGILLSALTFSVRGGDVLLRIVLFPVMIPLFMAAVDATARAFGGKPPEVTHAAMIVAFDLTFLGAGHLLFDHGVQDLGSQG